MTLKCAVYARVSTEYDSQKTSIPTQIRLFENFIKEQGWELYEIYTDVKSGTKVDRKGIQKLMQDAKENKFDIVLAKELSRISRNGEFSYQFKNILLEKNIDIVTLDGAINTLDNNSMNFGLFAWLSEQEAERTSKRVKLAYEVRAKNGKFDEAPYGYDLKDGQLYLANDDSPMIVKFIFKSYINGKSFDAIARELFNQDVPTPAQRKGHRNANIHWHGSTVRQILEREIYTGCLVAKKTSTISPMSNKRRSNKKEDWIIHENTHDPIIDKPEFELVQQLIKSRKRVRAQQHTHLFTGHIFCATCGSGMHFKRDRYVCGAQNKHGKKACPKNFRPKEDVLSEKIIEDINNLFFNNLRQEMFEKITSERIKLNERKLKKNQLSISLKKELESLKGRKQKALNLLLDDLIDQDAYDSLIKQINPKIAELDNELSNLVEDSNEVDLKALQEHIAKSIDINSPIKSLNKSILSRFIHKIVVKADGNIEVHYRTSNPSAFYVSSNIKLEIPKTRPNKAYNKKHA